MDIEELQQLICDEYCKYASVAKCQEELNMHCDCCQVSAELEKISEEK